jgi:calpain-15
LKLEDKDDGIFWMSVIDFRKYYEGVGVCKMHDKYRYNSLKCVFEAGKKS